MTYPESQRFPVTYTQIIEPIVGKTNAVSEYQTILQ